jgi:hypothetical protein
MTDVPLECGHRVRVSLGNYIINKAKGWGWYCRTCDRGPLKEVKEHEIPER